MGMNGNRIDGDLTVLGTGTGSLRLSNNTFGASADAPNVITINGKVKVLGSPAYLTASGSGTPVHYTRVIVEDSLIVDGSASTTMLQLGNGSGCYASWWVRGNVRFGACTLNTNNTNQDSLVFCGTGVQTLVNSNNTNFTKMAVVVYSGSTLSMADGTTFGAATNDFFILKDNATFICGSTNGLSGNITSPLANTTLSTTGNYTFAGTAAQVTSSLMPATVKNVTINNAAGVTSSQSLTITDTLFLVAGTLSGPYTAGTTITDVEGISGGPAPKVFQLCNNYPNPFNPSTVIRFAVPVDGYTTLKVYNMLGQEVATLFHGIAKAGQYIPVTFNAAKMASGVYFARLQQNSKTMVQRMVFAK
jgi:hypothetical protein